MPDPVVPAVPDKPAMPDVTKLQIVAVVQFIAGFAAAFGLDLSNQAQDALIQGCSLALVILPLADAWLRGRRATALGMLAQAHAAVAAAAVAAPSTVVQNAPAATGDATINTGGADAPGLPSTTPPTPAEQVPVGGAPMIDASPTDRPYVPGDEDADDRHAVAGISDAHRDPKNQPDPGDADEPSPAGDGEHPVTPSAAG